MKVQVYQDSTLVPCAPRLGLNEGQGGATMHQLYNLHYCCIVRRLNLSYLNGRRVWLPACQHQISAAIDGMFQTPATMVTMVARDEAHVRPPSILQVCDSNIFL